MVGITEQDKAGPIAQAPAQRAQLIEAGEVVACALHKQHWDMDIKQMSAAVTGWPAGRVKRKAEER